MCELLWEWLMNTKRRACVECVRVCPLVRSISDSPRRPGVSVHPEGFDDYACLLSETLNRRLSSHSSPTLMLAIHLAACRPPSQELLFNQRHSDKSIHPCTLGEIYLCFWSALRAHNPTSSMHRIQVNSSVCMRWHIAEGSCLSAIRRHWLFSQRVF